MAISISPYALCTLDFVRVYMRPIPAAAEDDRLTLLINAATKLIEGECAHNLKSRSYIEWYDGSGDRELALPQFPVISVERLSIGRLEAIDVQCDDATGATAAYVEVNDTHCILTIDDGTNAGTASLGLTTFPTLILLAAAINAAAGSWTARTWGAVGGFQSVKLYRVGQLECFGSIATLMMPEEAEPDYSIDYSAGALIVDNYFPRGRLNIYVEYIAGYDPIPDDLQQICAELVKRMYNESSHDTTLKSERLGDYAWTAGEGGGILIDGDMKHRLAPYKAYLP